jgi:hypothetical protein
MSDTIRGQVNVDQAILNTISAFMERISAAYSVRGAWLYRSAVHLLLDNEFTDDACNRAYYSMFDAARAALIVGSARV